VQVARRAGVKGFGLAGLESGLRDSTGRGPRRGNPTLLLRLRGSGDWGWHSMPGTGVQMLCVFRSWKLPSPPILLREHCCTRNPTHDQKRRVFMEDAGSGHVHDQGGRRNHQLERSFNSRI
jgi:hypothetical protein